MSLSSICEAIRMHVSLNPINTQKSALYTGATSVFFAFSNLKIYVHVNNLKDLWASIKNVSSCTTKVTNVTA